MIDPHETDAETADPHAVDVKAVVHHVEGWFMTLDRSERIPLLARLTELNDEFPDPAPYMTPEQVAMIERRAEEVDRGEVELIGMDEHLAGLSELIRRVGAGEDPEAVKAELRGRREERRSREPELADVV